MRRAARTDATQAAIIEALKRAGVSVEVIGKPVDLLICCRGVTALMECKSMRPTSEGGSNGLTKDQVEFIARWPGTVHIVRSPEQAVRAAVGEKAMA
jgi:hypothetical protein